MACDNGIYFKRDEIFSICHYGFVPYHKVGEECCE